MAVKTDVVGFWCLGDGYEPLAYVYESYLPSPQIKKNVVC